MGYDSDVSVKKKVMGNPIQTSDVYITVYFKPKASSNECVQGCDYEILDEYIAVLDENRMEKVRIPKDNVSYIYCSKRYRDKQKLKQEALSDLRDMRDLYIGKGERHIGGVND